MSGKIIAIIGTAIAAMAGTVLMYVKNKRDKDCI